MSELHSLREGVCEANRALAAQGLTTLTWGNVSGIAPSRDAVAIKPSGVCYEKLRPDDIVVVDLEGRIIEGSLRPSTDTPTHLALYRAWPSVGGVAHTHSPYATMFAQARLPIPCLGTTHADYFAGAVPVTRQLTANEVASGYEARTGRIIVEHFGRAGPEVVPAVLLPGHGPFAWGPSAARAVENTVALEAIARIAHGTLALGAAFEVEPHILRKHYERKHGPGAYYGQPT